MSLLFNMLYKLVITFLPRSKQGYGFSSGHAWMWELDYKEGWALKNWCFWTVVLEKTLESPLDCKEIQSVHPKEISPEYSLEVLLLKLKLQYLCHLMERSDSFEKALMLGKTEGGTEGDDRGWDGWMASPTQWTWVSVNSRSWWQTERPGVLQSMGSQSRTRLSDWTELVVTFLWYEWEGYIPFPDLAPKNSPYYPPCSFSSLCSWTVNAQMDIAAQVLMIMEPQSAMVPEWLCDAVLPVAVLDNKQLLC